MFELRSRYIVCLVLLVSMPAAFAQKPNPGTQSPERRLLHGFLQDQKAIWTSPAHVKRQDLKWLLPFVAGSAGLIASDQHNSRALAANDDDEISLSHGVSNAGFGAMAGALGASYLSGRLRHSNRAVETGLLGAEAIADSAVVDNLMKLVINRRRPETPGADGSFWSGGKSFPSSYSMMAWSAAAVLSERYTHNPLVKIASFSAAAAVSFTRVTGKDHYPSDVFVGAVLGYLIGRHVVRHRF